MAPRLDGRSALVTGGARGLGAAIAQRFAAEGARVAVADILDAEGEKLVAELGPDARYVHLDVSCEQDWTTAVDAIADTSGPPEILVNTAGIASLNGLLDVSLEEYLRVIGVNQVGVFLGMRAVIPGMLEHGRGSIVNVSSIDGIRGIAHGGTSYTASKFAVTGMSKTAALEFADKGIRVNSIHPGAIRTPIFDDEKLDMSAFEAAIPMKRAGTPDEIADLALFLASEESTYCTGAEFVIDGGVTAGVFTHLVG